MEQNSAKFCPRGATKVRDYWTADDSDIVFLCFHRYGDIQVYKTNSEIRWIFNRI